MLTINNNKKKPSLDKDFCAWLEKCRVTVVKKSSRLYGPHYSGVPYGVFDDDDDYYQAYRLPKKTLDAIYGYDDDYDELQDYLGQDYEDDYRPYITPQQLKALTERYGGTCTDDIPSSSTKRGKRGSKKKNKNSKYSIKGKGKKEKPKSAIDDMKDGYDHLSEDRSIFFYPNLSDQQEYETFSNIWELDCYLQSVGIDLPTNELHKICESFETHCCLNPIKLKEGVLELAVEESYGHLRWEYDPSIQDYDLPFETSPHSPNEDLPF